MGYMKNIVIKMQESGVQSLTEKELAVVNRTCGHKKAYHSVDAAVWFGKLGRLNVYKCQICGLYHNTSQAKQKVEVKL